MPQLALWLAFVFLATIEQTLPGQISPSGSALPSAGAGAWSGHKLESMRRAAPPPVAPADAYGPPDLSRPYAVPAGPSGAASEFLVYSIDPPSVLQYDSRSQHPDSPIRRGPAVPEPLLFDLVRPLGAAVGEVEVNTLVAADRDHISWAPEIEAVVLRDLALELELPGEDGDVEAYKTAVQYTIGTGWEEQMIHGLQGIYERQRSSGVNELSLLHITAARFDPTWSALWMVGGRGYLGGEYDDARADLLVNASVFADLAEHLVGGFETNLAQPLGSGSTTLKLIPQLHFGFSESLHLQVGFGLLQEGSSSSGLATARLIWAF